MNMSKMQLPTIKKNPSFKKKAGSFPWQSTKYSGWLWKKGLSKTVLSNRRWFEIKGDQLYYFKNKGDNIPLGQVSLPGNEIIKHQISTDMNGKYTFEIVAGKERFGRPVVENCDSFLLGASTPLEIDGWIKAINRVIYTPLGGGMFGRSILETVRIDSRIGGGMVPIVVEKCVEYIRQYGFAEEGIFRVPGFQDDVEELKNKFNKGENPDLLREKPKVNVVASVLKQYIGDLPDPVIPSESYDPFVAVGGLYKIDPSVALKKIEYLLQRIPRAHFNMLKYLCRFLFELQLNEEQTKMTVVNLALVFSPNILRPKNSEDPELLLKSLAAANTTTMAIIVNQKQLFPDTPDENYYQAKSPTDDREWSDFISFDEEKYSPEIIHTTPSYINPYVKRSQSDSSLYGDRSGSNGFENLAFESSYQLEEQKAYFLEQIQELERKLDAELKIREMLKLRLYDEHKSRVAAEDRLEHYRAGVEEYCKKFGHIDISIP